MIHDTSLANRLFTINERRHTMRDTKLVNGQRAGRMKGQVDDLGMQLAELRNNEEDSDIQQHLDRLILSAGMLFDDFNLLLAHLNSTGNAQR